MEESSFQNSAVPNPVRTGLEGLERTAAPGAWRQSWGQNGSSSRSLQPSALTEPFGPVSYRTVCLQKHTLTREAALPDIRLEWMLNMLKVLNTFTVITEEVRWHSAKTAKGLKVTEIALSEKEFEEYLEKFKIFCKI